MLAREEEEEVLLADSSKPNEDPLIRAIINVCVLHVSDRAGCVACGRASIYSGTHGK